MVAEGVELVIEGAARHAGHKHQRGFPDIGWGGGATGVVGLEPTGVAVLLELLLPLLLPPPPLQATSSAITETAKNAYFLFDVFVITYPRVWER